jgi:Cu(I)/Ag(I) efflux system membrane fusion protein
MKKCFFTVVAGMFILSACGSGNSNNTEQNAPAQEEAVVASVEHATLGVQGSCDMCKAKIETAALGVEGVTSASWDKEKKQAHLAFDSSKTSVDAISKAIAQAGYDTDKDKSADKTYNALPECCKYR